MQLPPCSDCRLSTDTIENCDISYLQLLMYLFMQCAPCKAVFMNSDFGLTTPGEMKTQLLYYRGDICAKTLLVYVVKSVRAQNSAHAHTHMRGTTALYKIGRSFGAKAKLNRSGAQREVAMQHPPRLLVVATVLFCGAMLPSLEAQST